MDHFLVFGCLSNNLSINNEGEIIYGIKGTKYAESIRQEVKEAVVRNFDPMILYMSIWSDDFEASTHRSNDCSIWIKTVTISPPSNQMNSPKYTFLLAIGRKGQDHDLVNERFNIEINELEKCTMQHYGREKCNIPVVVKVLSVLCYRPERSSMTCIQAHNAINAKRWGYSTYIKQDKFPSCKSCF